MIPERCPVEKNFIRYFRLALESSNTNVNPLVIQTSVYLHSMKVSPQSSIRTLNVRTSMSQTMTINRAENILKEMACPLMISFFGTHVTQHLVYTLENHLHQTCTVSLGVTSLDEFTSHPGWRATFHLQYHHYRKPRKEEDKYEVLFSINIRTTNRFSNIKVYLLYIYERKSIDEKKEFIKLITCLE